MKAWRNLALEKRNALVLLLIFLIGFIVALLTIRPQTLPIVKLWEREHGDFPWQWHEIAFSSDGKYVISAAQTVKVWRTKDGQLVRSLPLTVTKYSAKAISPNGRWIATYERDGTVKLWKLPEGKVVRTLKGERAYYRWLLAFSPNGKFLVAASCDLGVVKIWRTESGDLVRNLSLGVNRILSLAASPNSKLLGIMISRSKPKLGPRVFLELWDLPTGKRLSSLEMPILWPIWVAGRISFSFSPDGKFLFAAGRGVKGNTVVFWKTSDVKTSSQIVLKGGFMAMGFHSRDSSLLFVHEDISQDLLTPLRPRHLTVPAFRVYGDVLTCWRLTESGLTKCWEVKNIVSSPLAFINPTSAFAFSPDGQLMAIVTTGGRIKLFRIEASPAQKK